MTFFKAGISCQVCLMEGMHFFKQWQIKWNSHVTRIVFFRFHSNAIITKVHHKKCSYLHFSSFSICATKDIDLCSHSLDIIEYINNYINWCVPRVIIVSDLTLARVHCIVSFHFNKGCGEQHIWSKESHSARFISMEKSRSSLFSFSFLCILEEEKVCQVC